MLGVRQIKYLSPSFSTFFRGLEEAGCVARESAPGLDKMFILVTFLPDPHTLNWWAEQKNARPLALANNKIKGNREKF
jgi:hypothetical protein